MVSGESLYKCPFCNQHSSFVEKRSGIVECCSCFKFIVEEDLLNFQEDQ